MTIESGKDYNPEEAEARRLAQLKKQKVARKASEERIARQSEEKRQEELNKKFGEDFPEAEK